MTRYIAIDGMGGSGKTYLSGLLAERLGARLFHLDDFGNDYEPFVGVPGLLDAVRAATDDVVIYEGVGVFDSRLDELQPFRILVRVPDVVRQGRIAGRDVPRDGRTAADWKEIWDIWYEAEAEYFSRALQDKADVVVGAVDGQFDVDELTERLRIA
ncbi:MAG: hypothetical protein WAS27_00670 [Candidatus Saccharimonadales bacterium]